MASLMGLVTKTTKTFLDVNTVSVDNWTFKMFYKVTTLLCVSSSVLATTRQFFGNPIICDAGNARGGIRDEVLESYCWMYAHFKIPPEYKGPCSGSEQDDFEGIIYNSYYQWVPIFLVFLGVMFYLPRCLWLIMEGGLMKFFGKGTTTRVIEDPEEKRDKLVEFFRSNIHNKYNIYYYGFVFCETLNVVVAVFCYLATNFFLHDRFLSYGFHVYTYYQLPPEEKRLSSVTNPMCYTFPRIAACTYYRYGTGGRQETINAICILGLNIVNDKVFLVLWWWFYILFIVGFLRILFRIVQINSFKLRYALLNLRLHRYFKKNDNSRKIKDYIKTCSKGDWFVLYQLSKNLNRAFFMDFLVTLSRILDEEKRNPDLRDIDAGDGIFDMMLKPTLTTYDSRDNKKNKDEDEDDDDD